MRINWFNHKFIKHDGYGRYGINFVRALVNRGVDVYPGLVDEAPGERMPGWMLPMRGLDFGRLNIQCMPGHEMRRMPGRVWGYTMVEDSGCPAEWPRTIDQTCERLLVPCEHNAEVFHVRGVKCPIHIIPGGTNPAEFPVRPALNRDRETFTFLALGDRGARKGFMQVWTAFYQTFPADQYPDVRLVVKTRDGGVEWMTNLNFPDRRLTIWRDDLDTMADAYALADVLVYPSFGEGWGMPPREAAMMGVPVIATRYSGLVDGIDHWATRVIENYTMAPSILDTADPHTHQPAKWAVPDSEEVGAHMKWCYENREAARTKALEGAQWLRDYQTWDHAAMKLMELIEQCQ